jgi:RNA polymerase sigma-70 factor, ECF subfamily
VGAFGLAESDRTTLRDLLLADYASLFRQLTRRLGSAEFAGEALQETYLRIEHAPEIGPVRSPRAYLLRVASNIAIDHRRAETRRLTDGEVDSLLEIADEAPDPARSTEARSEIDALKRAIVELSPRRKEIFLAARVEEIPHRVIAERLGVTVRTVEVELKHAIEHCAERLKRSVTRRFGPKPRHSSSD